MEHLNEANWKRENSNLATCEVYSVEQNDLNSREISLGFILGLNTWSFQPVKINWGCLFFICWLISQQFPGADPGFPVRGGALKNNAPSEGRRENFWGVSCEKSRFYTKKSYFFQLRREAGKFLGYFVWKITILRQKIIFFPILGGARTGCAPWIRPWFLLVRLHSFVSFLKKGSCTRTWRPYSEYNRTYVWYSKIDNSIWIMITPQSCFRSNYRLYIHHT